MLRHGYLLLLYVFAVQAVVYEATFTWYGQGDERGSPDCRTARGSCGFIRSPGFTAAVSQNLFGASSGSGPYCGKCLKLNARTNLYNNETIDGAGRDVVVMVDNLCPPKDIFGIANPLCAQSTLNSTNYFGGTIDVNLCADTGARDAVFGGGDAGLALGTAEEVDCAEYQGTRATEDGIIGAAVNQGQLGMDGGVGVRVPWGTGAAAVVVSCLLGVVGDWR